MPDTGPSLEILRRLGLNVPDEPLSFNNPGNISEAANALQMKSQPLWKQYGQAAMDIPVEGVKGLLGMQANPDTSNAGYIANAFGNIGSALDPVTRGSSLKAGLPLMMGGLKNVARDVAEEAPSIMKTYQALPAVADRLTKVGLNPTEFSNFDTMADAYFKKTGSSILAHEMPNPLVKGGPLTNPTPGFVDRMKNVGLDPRKFSNVDEMSDAYFKKTGSSILASEAPTNVNTNASGDSMASGEALSRMQGMKSQGKQFVVYDRAGNMRPLIGPEAVDYKPRPGETYGVQTPNGFQMLENRGGLVKAYRGK